MTVHIEFTQPTFILSGFSHEEIDGNPFPNLPHVCPDCHEDEAEILKHMTYQIETILSAGIRGFCLAGHWFDVDVLANTLTPRVVTK